MVTTYSVPGVYVQENQQSLAIASNFDSADAIATFVGKVSSGGQVAPTLVTSWSNYVAQFGNISGTTDDLPFAVYSYFANGGSRCYVQRVTSSSIVAASSTFNNTGADPVLVATAKAPGAWANSVTASPYNGLWVSINTAASGATFDLYVTVVTNGAISAVESFPFLTLDPTQSRYAFNVVNSSVVGSQYITLSEPDTDFNYATDGNPASTSATYPYGAPFTGGADSTATTLTSALTTSGAITSLPVAALPAAIPSGTTLLVQSGSQTQTFTTSASAALSATSITVTSTTPNFAYPIGSSVSVALQSSDYTNALNLLGTISNILVVNLPGISDATNLGAALTWLDGVVATGPQNRFLIIDSTPDVTESAAVTNFAAQHAVVATHAAANYTATYGPWLYLQDPSNNVTGSTRLTAPGGAVLGQYAFVDANRGVFKTPAGIGTVLTGVVAPAVTFSQTNLGTENTQGVNIIRAVPGAGFCIMGGRTGASPAFIDKYINVRRTLMYVKQKSRDLTRSAVFENNDPATWDTVAATLTQFLQGFWQQGGLLGATAEQAFFVVCDETNNTPATVQSGVLNVQIGVALATPAEFVVITIGQFDGGATVNESTTGV